MPVAAIFTATLAPPGRQTRLRPCRVATHSSLEMYSFRLVVQTRPFLYPFCSECASPSLSVTSNHPILAIMHCHRSFNPAGPSPPTIHSFRLASDHRRSSTRKQSKWGDAKTRASPVAATDAASRPPVPHEAKTTKTRSATSCARQAGRSDARRARARESHSRTRTF